MENLKETRLKLREYLTPLTRYRETNDEVFDHVLKVIESQEQPFSEIYVGQIIEDEFGGVKGIKLMEQEAILATKEKVSENYWQEFRLNFKGKKLFELSGITLMWIIICFFSFGTNVPKIFVLNPALIFLYVLALRIYFLIKKENKSLYSKVLFQNTIYQFFPILCTLAAFWIFQKKLDLSAITFTTFVSPIVVLFMLHFKVFWRLHLRNLNLQTA